MAEASLGEEERERRFVAQSHRFIERYLAQYGLSGLGDVEPVSARHPRPLEPVVIRDYTAITDEERERTRAEFFSQEATVAFVVMNPDAPARLSHPLLELTEQLVGTLPVEHPIAHHLDQAHAPIPRLGEAHGVVPVFDQGGMGVTGHDDLFAHQAGLGSCGSISCVALWMDSPPLFNGYTYFQNMCRLAMELSRVDRAAFEALFLPDALTITRTTGSGIRVQTPVLFVNEQDQPQCTIQSGNAGYSVEWRRSDALARGVKFLFDRGRPFSPGCTFVHMTRRGHGVLVRNPTIAHGRTPFINGGSPDATRRLVRKWYASTREHAAWPKVAPGMVVHPDYASLYAERFTRTLGTWRFDPAIGENVRVS